MSQLTVYGASLSRQASIPAHTFSGSAALCACWRRAAVPPALRPGSQLIPVQADQLGSGSGFWAVQKLGFHNCQDIVFKAYRQRRYSTKPRLPLVASESSTDRQVVTGMKTLSRTEEKTQRHWILRLRL